MNSNQTNEAVSEGVMDIRESTRIWLARVLLNHSPHDTPRSLGCPRIFPVLPIEHDGTDRTFC
jgi:hypothetical protein